MKSPMLVCTLTLMALSRTPAAPPSKGHFVLVGGGAMSQEMGQEFFRLAGGKNARIVVIPSATPWASPRAAANRWESLGAQVSSIHVKTREEAANPKLYDCLDNATGVWFGGGDQGLLADLFAGTPLNKKLRAVLDRNGAVGGFSAGASVVTQVMVLGSGESTGFGLLDEVVIDQHFTQRNRLPRLMRLVEKHPSIVGYGIDSSTAVVISEGKVRVLGEGAVTRCVRGEKPIRLTRSGLLYP